MEERRAGRKFSLLCLRSGEWIIALLRERLRLPIRCFRIPPYFNVAILVEKWI
jgi:hypothetical protein